MPISTDIATLSPECPWCGIKQKPEEIKDGEQPKIGTTPLTVASLGREKAVGKICSSCGHSFAVVLKSIYYRCIKV
jgi:hypothetical protein